VVVRLADVTPEPVDWLWPGRLARGKLTLFAGDPGLGKSLVTMDLAARLSRGAFWPDGTIAPRGTTLLLSAEDGLADTIRPRLDRHDGDAAAVHVLTAVRDKDAHRPLDLAGDLARLADAIRQVRPSLIVIDPLTAYLGETDAHRDGEVRALLAPLVALLEQERVALLAVAHLSKDQQRSALHRPGGSVAFIAAARLALCLGADPTDPDRRVLAGLKSNLGPLPPTFAFRVVDGRVTWEDTPVEGLDVETLLHSPQADRAEQSDAEGVLSELLADESAWPLDAKDALAAGHAHGVHERTMRRAARRLGIRIDRVGFGRGGCWLWQRPIADSIEDTSLKHPDVSPMAAMTEQARIGDNNNIEDTHSVFTRAREDAPFAFDNDPFGKRSADDSGIEDEDDDGRV
jgi:hypothetical protein